MDFVFTPPSTVPPVEIPVLLHAPYQIPGPYDLHTFLQQSSPDKDESSLSAIEIATLIQSKLFLGLLAVLLGATPNLEKISILKTINGETGRYFCLESISTTPFSVYKHFGLWLRRRTIFEDLKKVRGRLDSLERLPNGKFSPTPEIALSTRVLIDTLILVTRAGLLVWSAKEKGPYFEAMQPCPYNQDDISPSLSLLFSRLKSSGLCLSRCISYSHKMTHLQLYYMSGITHHSRGLDHNRCSNSECTASSRQEHPVDKPRHCVDGCDCNLQFTSDDLVSSILARGKIPLVRITRFPESSCENRSRLSISIEPARISSQYYAISHVWSDGMGNADENSVYYCWLQLIFEKLSWNTRNSMTRSTWEVSEIPLSSLKTPSESSIGNEESYLFWLDILCIPAKAKGQQYLRRQAIERIPAVFSGARKVLIFDSEMMRSRLGASKPVEVLGRFLGCNWPTRGWTYQEGAHSLPAMIQLSDCAIDARNLDYLNWDWRDFMCPRSSSLSWTEKLRYISEPYRLAQISLQTMMEKSIFIAFVREMKAWFPMEDVVLAYVGGGHDYQSQGWLGRRRALAFAGCWNQLLSRSSSDESDKLIILAMAMNLSVYQVMHIPRHERLTSMIWSLSAIPLEFLVIPPAQSTEAPEMRTVRSMRNLWVPEYFNSSIFNTAPTILAKVQGHFGHFSKDGKKIYISLSTVPGGRHMAITIPEPLKRLPWLRLQHFDQNYVVQFHRAADNSLDFSQYAGAVFMVDLHPLQAKPGTEGETWMPGCCLLVKDQNTMEVIYDSALSVLKAKDCQEPYSFDVQSHNKPWSSVASLTVNSCLERPPLSRFVKSQYHTTSLTTVLRDAWKIYSPIGTKKDDIVLALLCDPPDDKLSNIDRRTIFIPPGVFLNLRVFVYLCFALWCTMGRFFGFKDPASPADSSRWFWLTFSALCVFILSFLCDGSRLGFQIIVYRPFRVLFLHIVPVLCGKRDPRDMRGLQNQLWTERAFEIPCDSNGLSVLSLLLLCLRYLDPILFVLSIPPLVVFRHENVRGNFDIGFYCIVGIMCLFAFLDGLVRTKWAKQRRVRWLASFSYPTVLKDSFVAHLQEKRKGELSGMGFQMTWSTIFSPGSFKKAKATANLAFDDD